MRAPTKTRTREPRQVTSADILPARVAGIEGGQDADHRVFIGDGQVRIFRARKAPQRGSERVLEAVVASATLTGRGTWTVQTEDGQELTVTKQGRCACGSPLQSINRRELRGLA